MRRTLSVAKAMAVLNALRLMQPTCASDLAEVTKTEVQSVRMYLNEMEIAGVALCSKDSKLQLWRLT